MCRHFLPRFNFPLDRALHTVGQVIASHPASAIALFLLPACAAILFVLHHRVGGQALGRWPVPGYRFARRGPLLEASRWASNA